MHHHLHKTIIWAAWMLASFTSWALGMSCFKQWWGTMRTEPLRLQPASDSGAPNSLTSSHTFQFEFIFLLWPKMMFALLLSQALCCWFFFHLIFHCQMLRAETFFKTSTDTATVTGCPKGSYTIKSSWILSQRLKTVKHPSVILKFSYSQGSLQDFVTM